MTKKKVGRRTKPETPDEWAERTRREQGLPAMVTDSDVLQKIGVLLRTARNTKRPKQRPDASDRNGCSPGGPDRRPRGRERP